MVDQFLVKIGGNMNGKEEIRDVLPKMLKVKNTPPRGGKTSPIAENRRQMMFPS